MLIRQLEIRFRKMGVAAHARRPSPLRIRNLLEERILLQIDQHAVPGFELGFQDAVAGAANGDAGFFDLDQIA